MGSIATSAATSPGTGTVHVLWFAWLRERVGRTEEELALPDGVATVAGLIAHLSARDPAHAAALSDPRLVRCAVNQDFVAADAPVRPGDEVAFFPPVTGG